MSPEAQRIAIAEACGWRFENYGTREFPNLYWRVFNPDGKLIEKDFTGADFRAVYVPDYLNDLNAMAEAMNYLRNSNRLAYATYAKTLETIVAIYNSSEERQAYHAIQVCDATAAQRADAFILALNLKPST